MIFPFLDEHLLGLLGTSYHLPTATVLCMHSFSFGDTHGQRRLSSWNIGMSYPFPHTSGPVSTPSMGSHAWGDGLHYMPMARGDISVTPYPPRISDKRSGGSGTIVLVTYPSKLGITLARYMMQCIILVRNGGPELPQHPDQVTKHAFRVYCLWRR